MKSLTASMLAAAIAAVAAYQFVSSVPAQPLRTAVREVPKFQPDANWAKLPSQWVWGQVSSVSIDEKGHAWVLQRPSTIRADQKGKAAPVLEFDDKGTFV